MKIELEPILDDCLAIYEVDGVMERFWAYVNLMTKSKGELLPLGDFSPMGTRQKEFINALIKMKAEEFVAKVCLNVGQEISSNSRYRLMLVVVDEANNGWTQRYLTDVDWRFSDAIEKLNAKSLSKEFDRWVVVNIWTTDDWLNPIEPTFELLEQSVRSAIFRAHWQGSYGYPKLLKDMMRQEGSAMNFAGERDSFESFDFKRTQEIILPILDSNDFPTNFSALYGDEAAASVGYSELGLTHKAGFALARAMYK